MSKKKKIKRSDDGIVYSTNPGFSLGDLLANALGDGQTDGKQQLEGNERKEFGRASIAGIRDILG